MAGKHAMRKRPRWALLLGELILGAVFCFAAVKVGLGLLNDRRDKAVVQELSALVEQSAASPAAPLSGGAPADPDPVAAEPGVDPAAPEAAPAGQPPGKGPPGPVRHAA
jgi:hypothetical protein